MTTTVDKSPNLSIRDICRICGTTPMTVYNWRNGRTNKTKLPCVVRKAGERGRVAFSAKALSAWLKRNAVQIVDRKEAKKLGIELG